MKKWITCFLAVLMSLTSISVIYAKEAMRLNGKITQLNHEAKTFVLSTEKESWKILWDEKTNFVFEGKKAEPSDLKEELPVMVAGKPVEGEKILQALVIAWGNNPGEKDPKDPGQDRKIPNIFGKMSQLNLTDKTFRLEFTDKDGNPIVFQVTYHDKTAFIRDRKQAKPEEFKDGEEVTVAGRVNPEEKTILAMAVALGRMKLPPGEDNDRPPMIFGKMTSLNLTQKTFNLELKDREGNPIIFAVTYSEETAFIREKKQAKPEDFKDGEEVTVAGRINPEDKKILAMAVILGKVDLPPNDPGRDPDLPRVFGKISQINTTEKTFLLELKDKDGNPIVFTVTYVEKTVFIRDKKEVKPEDFKDGEEITVAGRINREDKKIVALIVVLGKVEPPPNNPGDRGPDSPPGAPYKAKGVQGKVIEVNHEKMQFTIQARGEILITIQYNDWTDFIKNGNFVFPKALSKDDKVIVFGPLDPEQKIIDAHYVVW